jgi:Tfp pilus assembly protein PilX
MDQGTQQPNSGGGRRGFALPLVIIMLVVAMLSCGAFLSVAYHEYNLSRQEEQYSQCLFLAQAGLQRTLQMAGDTSDFTTLDGTVFADESLGTGTYTVNVNAVSASEATITATGRVSGRSRTVSQKISRD